LVVLLALDWALDWKHSVYLRKQQARYSADLDSVLQAI
jgi:hypothetical protein